MAVTDIPVRQHTRQRNIDRNQSASGIPQRCLLECARILVSFTSVMIVQSLVFASAVWAFSRKDGQPCHLTAFPAPQVMDAPGCSLAYAADGQTQDKAYCVPVSADERICKCVGYTGSVPPVPGESADDGVLVLQRRGVIVGAWNARAFLGDTDKFAVLQGDLDGNGTPEIVIVNHDGTSNGMAVNYATLGIIPNLDAFQTPVFWQVEDYGPGSFVRYPKFPGCALLTTEWEWFEKLDPQRGSGLYLIGHEFRYHDGFLLPVTEHPIRARRYLFAFETERDATLNFDVRYDAAQKAPLHWLQHATTKLLPHELLSEDVLPETSTGTIRGVHLTPDEYLRLDMERESGTLETVVCLRLGDVGSGRLYPKRYLPARLEQWLVGQTVKLTPLPRGNETSAYIVWVYPPSETSATCFPLEPEKVSLTGVITRQTFPGPPNYESIAAGDRPETYWILNPATPVCVQAVQSENKPVTRVSALQLVFVVQQHPYEQFRDVLNQSVTVTGSLFEAHTGHHHTKILLDVQDMQRVDSQNP